MPLTSLPMELHREVMVRLDLASLFCFSKTNRYFRTVYMALPPKDIQGTVDHYLLNDPQRERENHYEPWGRCEEWNALYSIEEDYPHLLKRYNLLPCYACYAVYPRTEFGDWNEKRLTEIDGDGMPLQGVCHTNTYDEFHLIFRAIVAKEAAGAKMRTQYDLDNDCQSYLHAAQGVEDEDDPSEIQALLDYLKSDDGNSAQSNEQHHISEHKDAQADENEQHSGQNN